MIANGLIGVNGVIVQNHVEEEESRLLPEGKFKKSFSVENHAIANQLANEIAIPANVQVYDFFYK